METHIQKLMELIDDASKHLPDGIYVDMCDTIKKIHTALPKKEITQPTADTIIPMPPPGIIIAPRPVYVNVNITATKGLLRSGTWKGDIITFNNNLYKVLRNTKTHIAVSLATQHPTEGFTFSLTATDRVYCSDDAPHTIVFRRC